MMLILVWFSAILLLIVNILFKTDNFWINGTIILGWFLFAIQVSYSKWESFYSFINKTKFYILNTTCYLTVTVKFEGDFERGIVENICNDVFENKKMKMIKIITLSNVRKSLILDDFELQVYLDEYNNELIFNFKEHKIGYRDTLKYIEGELQLFLEYVNEYVKPDSKRYFMNIRFKNENPFFGFYTQKVKKEEIIKYEISFMENNSIVDISLSSLDISSESNTEFILMAKKYLAIPSKP